MAYLSSTECALVAHKLKDRRDTVQPGPRWQLLDRMRRAYMAMGLSKTHAEFKSPQSDSLMEAAVQHLLVARALRNDGRMSEWLC